MLINILLAGTPAESVSGGVMTSQNGNLSIDLNTGQIRYTDGVNTIFNLGGSGNDLTITNNQSNNILNTNGSTNILDTILGAQLAPSTSTTQGV
jgi:hypothetical protein